MPRLRRLRHRFEYIVFLTVVAAIRALPLELASRWSGACWRFVAPRMRRHRRALDHLSSAFPEKSAAEIQAIALGMWDNLGRTFAEFFHIDEIVNSDRIQIEPSELFDALRAQRGGFVACSLHLGNWEIVSQAALRLGRPPAGVYQKITNPFVDRYVSAIRAPLYPGGLTEKSSGAARILLRYAREGGCVAFLADQREWRGIAAPFFGRLARSTSFPALIARSLETPLFVCRAKRLSGVRFSLRVEQLMMPRTANRDADVATATGAIQAAFEAMIRDAPDQWMWAHRRWD
jgi:KDO2-lipid IV(A) lauroyltransferase